MKKNSIVTTIILSIILYAISTGVSWGVFNLFSTSKKADSSVTSPVDDKTTNKAARFQIDPSLPRKEECPLNGMLYTEKEKAIWGKRRPLAVMIENSSEARPHSGLSLADVVYEAVAEGGVTRFMSVFYCGGALGNINVAPVRSARTYYLDWVSEYDALYNHVGGANTIGDNITKTTPEADAISQIDKYGIKDLDQFGISYPDCFRNPDRLDHPVATEHSMVCLTDNLYKIGEERGWTNVDEDGIAWDKNFVEWKFKDDSKIEDRPEALSVDFGFWDGYTQYDVKWVYDKQTNSFKRYNGGVEQKDLETDQTIMAKNVIIQFSEESVSVDENKHNLYETIGQNDALIVQDGKAVKGTWNKKNRLARTLFYDSKGTEVKFNRGQIWIEVIPEGNKVVY